MTIHKTYTGAAMVALGGVVSFFNYRAGDVLIALGFAIIFIGLRHAIGKLIK